MVIKRDSLWKIAIFLILYYIYLNPLKKIFIPGGSITIALMLVISLVLIVYAQKGQIFIKHNILEKVMNVSWLSIAMLMIVNNANIIHNFIYGGMIHFIIMVLLLVFSKEDSNDWINFFLKLSIFFVMIHVFATIYFYFAPNAFYNYARFMFTGEQYTAALKYYEAGYMAGLNDHFSSNGMYFGYGCIYIFMTLYKQKHTLFKKLLYILCLLLCTYALILSSKRAPFIAVIIMLIGIVFLCNNNNPVKRFSLFISIALIGFVTIFFIAPSIPGLSTIIDKFTSLEDSDAGVLNGRFGLWEIAINMFKESPLIGKGYGSYAIISESLNAITTSAHNYYLQVLAEYGLVGFILYVVAFISSILYTFKKLMKAIRYKDNDNVCILAISFGIQGFVLIYNMTATAMMYYTIMIPYFVSCMMAKSCNTNYERKEQLI